MERAFRCERLSCFLLRLLLRFDQLSESLVEDLIDDQQGDERGNRSGKCTERAARGTVRETVRIADVMSQQKIGCADAHTGVYDLLDDLRDRRRHHVAVALEVSADNSHDGEDQNGRRQNLKRQDNASLVDRPRVDVRPEITGKHRDVAHHQAEPDGDHKHFSRVSVLSLYRSRTHQLGHRERKAVRREQQRDIVKFKRYVVVSDGLLAEDRRHRDPVQHADKTDDQRCRGKDRTLHKNIVRFFVLFRQNQTAP